MPVDSERLDGFGVAPLFAVYGDDVEEFVVPCAMHCETYADNHGEDATEAQTSKA